MPFLSHLLMNADDGIPVVLTSPLVYESPTLKRVITVPAGFVSDLASVPRALWSILPPLASYTRAAVVHDYLYVNNGVTRAQADKVLLDAMRETGVGWWTRSTVYSGVRAGGFIAWNRYRKAQSSQENRTDTL